MKTIEHIERLERERINTMEERESIVDFMRRLKTAQRNAGTPQRHDHLDNELRQALARLGKAERRMAELKGMIRRLEYQLKQEGSQPNEVQ